MASTPRNDGTEIDIQSDAQPDTGPAQSQQSSSATRQVFPPTTGTASSTSAQRLASSRANSPELGDALSGSLERLMLEAQTTAAPARARTASPRPTMQPSTSTEPETPQPLTAVEQGQARQPQPRSQDTAAALPTARSQDTAAALPTADFMVTSTGDHAQAWKNPKMAGNWKMAGSPPPVQWRGILGPYDGETRSLVCRMP